MTSLPFVANSEDVLLAHVLGEVDAGFYLDWDSDAGYDGAVTQTLHDRGWHGLSIVQTLAQAEALARIRPADRVIALQQDARPDLSALVQTNGAREVHAARIHVGASQAGIVAAIVPLAPWLVLARAGDPASEAILASAGLHAALTLGLNRVYVAAARSERLLPRLRATANLTDGYVRVADVAVARHVEAAEASVAVARAREAGSLQRMADAVRAAGLARADVGTMAEEAKWLRGLADTALAAEASVRAEAAWLRSLLDDSRDLSGRLRAEADWRRNQVDEGQRQIDELRHEVSALQNAAERALDRAVRAETEVGQRLTARIWRRLDRLRGRPNPVAIQAELPPAEPAKMLESAPPQQAVAPMPGPPPVILPAPVDNPSPAHPTTPSLNPAPPRQHGPLTTVHQFHAGSAPGNAITNSMILIRDILRARGFRSEIYVKQRAAGLEAQNILMLDELPRHEAYALLLHHSMGYPEFDEVAALPAPKILIYHNITPPQFLSAIPRIARMAKVGREQLAALRDKVAFALADSDYNAIELQALRFPLVRTCPLLFDVSQITERAAEPRISDGVFTILFVGRVTPSKGQDALVEAFAGFRSRFDAPSRLVLVGALDADDHEFLSRIENLIDRFDLRGDIHLTGLVSDDELRDWYRQADLYVSLSQHEGFCVPLVEAMAHGVPVLAWPSGAVAETLGDAAALLPSREPAAVAERIAQAARDLRPRVGQALSRFALDRHLPVLMQALASAGAFAPPDRAAHRQLAAHLHVAIAGHVAKTYSLAAVNRTMAAVLERERPGAVRVIPVEGAPTDDLSEVPPSERPLIERLAARGKPEFSPELVLSQHYPVYVPDAPADLKMALFFWEESLVPAATVETLCAGFDAVLAPSSFVARALVNSGMRRPVITLGHAPGLAGLEALGAAAKEGPFTFLHVSSAFPRKGIDALLAAWRIAFTADEPVRLVLKVFPNPHNEVAGQMDALHANGSMAPVDLIDADLTDTALHTLFAQADAMVLPTRGEGYNLVAAEAMAAGIPLITTAYGGHMDFCPPGSARLVARRIAASGSHLATPHSLWAEPDVADLAAALREAFVAGRGGLVEQRRMAQAAIAAAADPAAWTSRLTAAAAALLLAPAAQTTRVAWVSSWNVACGIAEYSRALLNAMPPEGITILADQRAPEAPDVRLAWRLGDPENAGRIAAAVGRLDADVVVIQHQPGLLEWGVLAQLTDTLVRQGRAVVVTLHNTRHLVERPAGERDKVVQSLDAVSRVVVHTLADIAALEAIGLRNPALFLPQSAPQATPAALRDLPPGSAPVIGCTGFFLPGKGIGTLIQAVASLRDRWPGIRLRLVNAAYDHPDSQAQFAACQALADANGLSVEWHLSFLPLEEIRTLLRGCDLLVLPYEHSKESSSAALRTALGSGVPVAVTPISLFDEAADAVARTSGLDAASIAEGIANLLADGAARRLLQETAGHWLESRSTSTIATRLFGLIEGLAAQRRLGQPLDGRQWDASA